MLFGIVNVLQQQMEMLKATHPLAASSPASHPRTVTSHVDPVASRKQKKAIDSSSSSEDGGSNSEPGYVRKTVDSDAHPTAVAPANQQEFDAGENTKGNLPSYSHTLFLIIH